MANGNFKFDPAASLSAIEELKKIQTKVVDSSDNLKKIVKLVSINWQGEASTTLCENMTNSLNIFQTYIAELNKTIAYLEKTRQEWIDAEIKNEKIRY
ncbi:MAG: hypothetical protein IKF36_04465 [Bacilli bacterium]|nr:hypothetical protein [Bacilli bacterium]